MENYSLLAKEIREKLPGLELRENEKMSEHCSFKIGGAAPCMALPASADEAAALCALLRQRGVKPLVMGNGTNLLVTDEPLDYFVVKFADKMSEVKKTGELSVTAECGVTLARLAAFSEREGLAGLEFAHGIPGTLGGAVCMNAGAYGGEMKDVLKSVEFLDGELQTRTLAADALELSYRHSVFSDTDSIVLSAALELTKGDMGEIKGKMRALAEKRRASQPLDVPSAGSTFKRPTGGYAAALIDEAGLRGYAVGGAQVSEKHTGFVINRGGATFGDVLTLMEHIQNTVYARSGISLEPEVRIIRNP